MSERCDAEHPPAAVICHEPPGHQDGGWHYDGIDDVTWRAGRHLPGRSTAPGQREPVRLAPGRGDAAGEAHGDA